jgi:hypothetical protein
MLDWELIRDELATAREQQEATWNYWQLLWEEENDNLGF